jgi:hypothetical protein
MARCELCGNEMSSPTVTTCSVELRLELGPMVCNGVEHEPVPFALDGPLERCPDCGVQRGGIHHWCCTEEECPACGSQLISCGCFDEVYYQVPEPGE